MYIQITNTTLPKFNIIRATKETLVQSVNKAGWKMGDCKFKQIQDALVDTVYRGTDGKNAKPSTKQYLGRAKRNHTINMKVNAIVAPLVTVL